MTDTINTNSFTLNPESRYIIEDIEIKKKVVPSKKSGKDVVIYELHGQLVDCDHDEVDTNNFKVGMFPNMMGGVLKALEAKEASPGVFTRPTKEELVGKRLEFHIIHQADNGGTLREVIIEPKLVKEEIVKKTKSEQVAWDE